MERCDHACVVLILLIDTKFDKMAIRASLMISIDVNVIKSGKCHSKMVRKTGVTVIVLDILFSNVHDQLKSAKCNENFAILENAFTV